MAKHMGNDENNDKLPISLVVSSISTVPVTEERKPYINPGSQPSLYHSGAARANLAPSAECPYGTRKHGYSAHHAHQTVLQQHCAFFDPDSDGIVYPLDTYRGFRELSFGILLSMLAVLIIHPSFSWWSLPPRRWRPDPWFGVHLANIHRTKHGSDTGTYDHEGRYVPQKFEEIFTKYADGRDYLTVWDVINMIMGQRLIADPIGWGGAVFEWTATFLMLWPENGRMMKEDIRRVYDGSIFYEIAAKQVERRRNR
ncbi:caleosin domain-containing protein [Pleomassaria siparia CBS 279.74]|uniref:Caleosin domain-containing protein n=1 Tax=Pleomassaria siparia CBS 279.74 TaxID=1314801 RepID=A0A6G1KPM7_9PLEO|nr:caleosin domain-containing protein [Pleomassaria siparia CBS 279.74]